MGAGGGGKGGGAQGYRVERSGNMCCSSSTRQVWPHRFLELCQEPLHSFLKPLWIIFSNGIVPGLKVKGTFQVAAQSIGNGIGDEIPYNRKALYFRKRLEKHLFEALW